MLDMFINCGFADEDERVRAEVLNAALEIIDVHGKPRATRKANVHLVEREGMRRGN